MSNHSLTPQFTTRRFFTCALQAIALLGMGIQVAVAAESAQKRSYLLMSLLGDSITVVTQQSRTGTRISQNARETISIGGGIFDKRALNTMDSAIKADAPAAEVTVLHINAVNALGDTSKFVADGQLQLPASLSNGLKQVSTTHFILALPYRADANIKGEREGVGSGMLQGLGFYVDRELRVTNTTTGDSRTGYLAPYVYFAMVLVDRASGKVLRQELVTEAYMLGDVAKAAGVGDPWEMLTTKEKVEAIQDMLDEQIKQRMPKVMAP